MRGTEEVVARQTPNGGAIFGQLNGKDIYFSWGCSGSWVISVKAMSASRRREALSSNQGPAGCICWSSFIVSAQSDLIGGRNIFR